MPNQQSPINHQQEKFFSEKSTFNIPVVRVRLDVSFLKPKYIVLFLAVATGVAGAVIAIYAYNRVGITNSLNIPIIAESDRLTTKEIEALVDKMSQISVLPDDETPTVLTISDLTKLHSNPFFTNAKLKDKIVIFKKAGRIILYDPLSHKIVNMGPYSESQQEATPTAQPAPQTSNPDASLSPEEASPSAK